MSRATLKVITTAAVAPAGTFAVPYTSQAQADFTDPQTVNVKVYERTFACAVTFGATEATVTWPGAAPYDLPPDEYYIDFDLIGGDALPADVAQTANIVDLVDNTTGTADGTLAVVGDTSTINQAATINDNFADLADKYNTLLAGMKAAGLMTPDA